MTVAAPRTLDRQEIADEFKWELSHIYPNWEAWEEGFSRLATLIDEIAELRGTLSDAAAVLRAFQQSDDMEQLAHRVYWYPSLMHDQDMRDNQIEARRQRVSLLLSRSATAVAWLKPELLTIPIQTMQQWLRDNEDLALYAFSIQDLYRQQEHVLDETNERILSFSSQLQGTPSDAYAMLTTADAHFPTVELVSGEKVKVTHARYHTLLNTSVEQADRAAAFGGLYDMYGRRANTFAAIYNGVCQRDWFIARSRNYPSTLDAALHGNDIPPTVVENLLATTRAGTEPLRRYFRLRKRILGLEKIHLYDGTVPLVKTLTRYSYQDAMDRTLESVTPLGHSYRTTMEQGFRSGWVDVYENEGKRSGAYSAPVYGVHPYMLMNYDDTLENMFTLAHEMGHSMHTVLSHEHQPFVYSGYTIFVAEVASTLNESLLLNHLLDQTDDPKERMRLLQHAIDSIVGTFYTQVLFADFELQAHQLVERGEPVTADALNTIYFDLLKAYYGDSIDHDERYRFTWMRIPHFFRSPYYVYQYATCFASAAQIQRNMADATGSDREEVVERYLNLLRSGGDDHPMRQLKKAGVDLTQPHTVQAVVEQLASLVERLERETDASA